MKKKIIITVSRLFPAIHSRFGEPTLFGHNISLGRKIHTIRSNYARWNDIAKKVSSGDYYLSIRQWSGRPYNSPQQEIAQIHNRFGIQRVKLSYNALTDAITAVIDDNDWCEFSGEFIAQNDGLSYSDFKEWFFGRHPKKSTSFDGVIIHFTDFRY